jgi:type IV pilus assembly protein PilB
MSGKRNGGGGKLPGWVLSSTNFLSMQYRIPTIALDEYEIDAAVIALVPKELCEAHRLIRVCHSGGSLVVAMADPVNQVAIDALKAHTGHNIAPVIASDAAIAEAITKYHR